MQQWSVLRIVYHQIELGSVHNQRTADESLSRCSGSVWSSDSRNSEGSRETLAEGEMQPSRRGGSDGKEGMEENVILR